MADSGRFANIHPGLSHGEALRILSLPVEQLDSSSDLYMAASHLINFPGQPSERALLELLGNSDSRQAVRLAKRKAVEVLARLGCGAAQGIIGDCLLSEDHYLVENAAWALQQLECRDAALHQSMVALLADPAQNRRVLIQSLAGLGVSQALPMIQQLQDDQNPGVSGAALAAVAKLSGSNQRISELADHFFLPNQMDRQSAIQDAIDASASELLPQILRSPVSPVFRMRALGLLLQAHNLEDSGLSLVGSVESLLWDSPANLDLVHRYDEVPDNLFLVNELFGTDFSRCYLALSHLKFVPSDKLWPILDQRWREEAYNDYGANYFFLKLFGSIQYWGEAQLMVEDLCESAIHNRRPQFQKSRPAGILALVQLNQKRLASLIPDLIDAEKESNWECRYAALVAQEMMLKANAGSSDCLCRDLGLTGTDPHRFVQAKKISMQSLFVDL
ncbi:HEAT repeat domain-containing protein [Cyanobium sp. HWJ4-Hawea]|nr:HEAT repeat domain-containing protein [Cyanobium sp. HWJ4-Hawea]